MGTLYLPYLGAESYEEYMQSLTLDYWWRLDTDFGATTGLNVGAAGVAPLTLMGPNINTLYNTTPVALNTLDGGGIKFPDNGYNWLNANSVRVDGTVSFTAGFWYKSTTSSTGTSQLLFRTNLGGTVGLWRGLDVYFPASADYLQITLGTNTSAGGRYYYRFSTPAASFLRNTNNFVAVAVTPTANPATIGISLYVNGVLQSLTYSIGTGITIAWPVTNSSGAGWNGIGFGAAGDTYGTWASGTYDEAFFHFGLLTQEQITGIYQRASV